MRKENIRYWITYLLLIIFFILGAVFYRQPFIVLIILLLAILPVFSIAILLFFYHNLEIKVSRVTPSVSIGHDIELVLSVINTSPFSFLNIELFYTFGNLFYERSKPQVISLFANAKKTSTFIQTYGTPSCGMIDITFDKLIITDYLHLWTVELPVPAPVNVPVFPKEITLTKEVVIPDSTGEEDDVTDSPLGQLSRDIKDIREYIPGDQLKDIHWKVSAKKDDLFVKLYETNAVRMIYLLPELTKPLLNDTITTLQALSKYLLYKREAFRIVIFSVTDKTIINKDINSAEDIDDAILKLYYCPSYDMKEAAYYNYKAQSGNEQEILVISGKEITVR